MFSASGSRQCLRIMLECVMCGIAFAKKNIFDINTCYKEIKRDALAETLGFS